ncbi:MAG: NAD-dependent epimerase/dehydratase family protein [Myxococcota bacterium]
MGRTYHPDATATTDCFRNKFSSVRERILGLARPDAMLTAPFMRKILVTGGAGYIGCILVPKLAATSQVTVVDALWFGRDAFDHSTAGLRPGAVELVPGDIRDRAFVADVLDRTAPDAVIHLAAVSNDPCSDLDESLTRSVNLEATGDLMRMCKERGVARLLNASSASVYGIKEQSDVTEDLSLEPLTLYARYKAETESIVNELVDDTFCAASVRAATVCGYSPRLRLDLTINILSYHALTRGEIRVFGGEQKRPNIHVQDLTDFYIHLLDCDAAQINGQAFNVVRENASVMALAEMIRDQILSYRPDDERGELPIRIVPTEDRRSYHLSGQRARRELNFQPKHELGEAVAELRAAFADGRIADPHHYRYRNIDVMKKHPERTRWTG